MSFDSNDTGLPVSAVSEGFTMNTIKLTENKPEMSASAVHNKERTFEAQRVSFNVNADSVKSAGTITEAIRFSRIYLPFFADQELDEQQTAGLREHLQFLDREFDKSQAKRVAQADAGDFQWPQDFVQRDMDQLIASGGNLEVFFREQQMRSSADRFNVVRRSRV